MAFLRKSIWPLREVVGGLERSESSLIHESTGLYLRDVYDHTIQVIDAAETFRDVLSGMLDIYLSSVSNRMNEVMKVLTIIATVFIPLTFIAGLYGMNFRYMPELEWPWGYPLVWIVMIVVAVLMVIYFRQEALAVAQRRRLLGSEALCLPLAGQI
jgi:magnesium transporter